MKQKTSIFQTVGFGRGESLSLEMKAKLFDRVIQLIDDKQLKQGEIAKLLKVQQPRVSDLVNGKISVFSIEMLLDFLDRLGGKAMWRFLSKTG